MVPLPTLIDRTQVHGKISKTFTATTSKSPKIEQISNKHKKSHKRHKHILILTNGHHKTTKMT